MSGTQNDMISSSTTFNNKINNIYKLKLFCSSKNSGNIISSSISSSESSLPEYESDSLVSGDEVVVFTMKLKDICTVLVTASRST